MSAPLVALPIAVIGAGAVGRVLALALAEAGLNVRAILSRSAPGTTALARESGAEAFMDLAALPADVRLVLICTPDAAIEPVARALAAQAHPWADTGVGHTSGALSVEALGPLRACGAQVFGFHPLQTLTRSSPASALHGAYAGIEEDEAEDGEAGAGVGMALASRLGMHPLPVRAEDKARYHLAATLASNGLVALVGAVSDVLMTLGIGRGEAFGVVAPLLRGTLDNLAAGTPETALTGPVARGDAATVWRHRAALRDDLLRLQPLYAALQHEALRVAVQAGRLSAREQQAVRQALGPSATDAE